MDMQHVLVQQLEKEAEVLTVVKERILTTDSCSVNLTKKQQCIFQGVLSLLGSSLKVSPDTFIVKSFMAFSICVKHVILGVWKGH